MKEVKTMQMWNESSKNFSEFAQDGDLVDEEIVMHFANCVPPRTYKAGMVQCGEPYSHRKEGATYATFTFDSPSEKYGEVWKYHGNYLGGSLEKGTPIPVF